MQLVGARPELERYVEIFLDEYEALLHDRPGITDLATLTFRHEDQLFQVGSLESQYVARILPKKLELSLKYSQARTFFSDLGIFFRQFLPLGAKTTGRNGWFFFCDTAPGSLPRFKRC